ncbi:MOSC domain-containing protein [Agrobacterium sp. SOY23]|uniref:MOSC domain-containing protein n=1 Tax=Agrobacterium sp. SOY23 TaxID=3014555 RepID=UPI0022AE92D1|nr:MOSC domain-containing protein [Agrobacterium sp. SOY23]MCZ4433036.1 MOSC domain-containing protein [Agrobacterium sp. SOY23]
MIVKHIGMTHVKATRLLDLKRATITENGILGDRDFILLNEQGMPLGPGSHRHFLPLRFDCDERSRRLQLTYPDGRIVTGECASNEAPFPVNYMDMRGIQVTDIGDEWNRRLREFSGVNVRIVKVVRSGAGVDVLPMTILTTGSLADLSRRLGYQADHRRFRANLIVDCDEPYAEDSWCGTTMRVGSAVIKCRSSVPRCVVTQLDPETGKNNARTVAALLEYRKKVHLPDGLMPSYANPGFASYAEVVEPGEVALGDRVTLERA